MYFRPLLVCLLLYSQAPTITAQSLTPALESVQMPMRFQAVEGQDQLGRARINVMYEDHLGFLWLGTAAGLVRYDGYEFRTFNISSQDTTSGRNKSISVDVYAIAEQENGDLWVGSRYEYAEQPILFRFDRQSEKLIPYPTFTEENRAVFYRGVGHVICHDDYLWINADRVYRIALSELLKQDAEIYNFQEVFADRLAVSGRINDLHEDLAGNLWLASPKGLLKWKKDVDEFEFIPIEFPNQLQGKREAFLVQIVEVEPKILAITSNEGGGIILFNTSTSSYEVLLNGDFYPPTFDLQSRSRSIWFGRDLGAGGLGIWDLAVNQIKEIDMQIDGDIFPSSERVTSIFTDFSGVTWVGMLGGRLLRYEETVGEINWMRFQADVPNSLSHDHISGIDQDQDGSYWISTYQGGLNKWNRKRNFITQYRSVDNDKLGPSTDILPTVNVDNQGRVWFGSLDFKAGFFNPSQNSFRHYFVRSSVMTVFHDQKGDTWLAQVSGGLRKYDPDRDEFRRMRLKNPMDTTQYPHPMLRGIYQDSQGFLWLGSESPNIGGFFRYNPINEDCITFKEPEAHTFAEDNEGFVWIGSQNGLLRFNPRDTSITRFTEEDGLPNNAVTTLIKDVSGYIWAGTSHGLCKINPDSLQFQVLQNSRGFPINELFNGAYQNEQGELFFYGTFGIVNFHPDSLRRNVIPPKLVFTSFEVNGLTKPIWGNWQQGRTGIDVEEVPLRYDENDLVFRYAAIHQKNPAENKYWVRLLPYDTDWKAVDTELVATYTNLDPGRYEFSMKATNSDGIESVQPISLSVFIRAPWFWNSWSKMLYLMLIFAFLYWFYQFRLKRKLAQAEAAQLRVLNQTRDRLYANITHEFRTPISIILGMAEQVSEDPQNWFREGVDMIIRNGRNLLHLVNQMLDLGKLESGAMTLHLVQGDVVGLWKYLTSSFRSYAETRTVELHFYSEPSELQMDHDIDKHLTIGSNLLSNAIKYTPSGGHVYVDLRLEKARTTGPPNLLIQVRDTGTGIAATRLPYIFDRFYQVDDSSTRQTEGTGIGLALTKELVHLLGGQINVQSKEGEGSNFTLSFPVQQRATKAIEDSSLNVEEKIQPWLSSTKVLPADQFAKEQNVDGDQALLLIVEDNEDVITHLKACLDADFKLIATKNGQDGLAKAIELIPDIIISDVMMPEMDGFELCRRLKEDKHTSHIPLILLTAKADQNAKIEGLEHGADAYLSKPFHKKELLVRLRKLIQLRKILQRKYQEARVSIDPDEGFTNQQDLFLQELAQVLNQNLDREGFGIPQVCKSMKVSRAQLYRKIKALTGLSPSIYIRSLRLAKAKILLQTTRKQIAEIGYEVGFSSPVYFTQAFSEEFGVSPSTIRKE